MGTLSKLLRRGIIALRLIKSSVILLRIWIGYLAVLVPWILISACFVRIFAAQGRPPRLVWGSTPIHNLALWSRAMRAAGWQSETFTHPHFSMHQREDWDKILTEEFPGRSPFWASHLAFVRSLWAYDVFFIPLNGFFLGFESSKESPNLLRRFHGSLLKFARKKVVLLPYGADAYVYRRIRSVALTHGLMTSYPVPARKQRAIAKDVDFWTDIADAVIPGVMGRDGIGRWDLLVPSAACVDLEFWRPSNRANRSDGRSAPVVVAHAPNHRGFKGTEFVIRSVQQLQEEGLSVELRLIEGLSLREVRDLLSSEVDILVEQLVTFGHGLNGVEGMASSLPVVSNLEDQEFRDFLDSYTYFGECPIVSANPSKLTSALRDLVVNPEKRDRLARAGRDYVERWHSPAESERVFRTVIRFIEGDEYALKNFYHPLVEEIPPEKR